MEEFDPKPKTMFDFILWYNNIDLKEVERDSGVSYPTLHKLKRGDAHNFDWRTLHTIAKCDCLSIEVSDFYDWENQRHKYFIINPTS